MERHIKFINIIFENCEYVRVPGDAVFDFDVKTGPAYQDNYHTTLEALSVSLSIETNKLSKDDLDRLRKRKDITHIHVYTVEGPDQEIRVPYPVYFHYWYQNPYQDNYEWDHHDASEHMLDIDIEPYWSILSIYQAIKDNFGFMMHNFPNGIRILFGGYWATFKRHLKWRNK